MFVVKPSGAADVDLLALGDRSGYLKRQPQSNMTWRGFCGGPAVRTAILAFDASQPSLGISHESDDSYFIYAFVVDAFLKIENSQNWQRKNLARVKKYPQCLATLCMAVLLRKFDAHVCVFTVCDRQNLKT